MLKARFLMSRIAILITLGWNSLALANPKCEEAAQLSREVRAVVGVLREAVNAQQLSVEKLRAFAEADKWQNPLGHSNRAPENLAFRQTFDRLTRGFSVAEKKQVKGEALAFSERTKVKNELRAESRERTRAIIDVRLISTPRSNGNFKLGTNSFSIGWVDGYPVIGAKYHTRVGNLRMHQIFPFPLPPRKLMSLTSTNDAKSNKPPAYFSSGGKFISFVFEDLKFSDLRNNDDIPARKFGLKGPENFRAEDWILIQTESGAKLFFYGHSDSTLFRNKLVMVDFEKPESGPRIISHERSAGLDEQTVGGRKFLTFLGPSKTVRFYDIEAGFLYPPIAAEFGESTFSTKQLALFEEQGRLKVAISAKEDTLNRIRVFDVMTQKEERSSDSLHSTPWGIFHFEYEGVPYAYFSTIMDVVVINLRDMSERIIPIRQFWLSQTGVVWINNHPYIPGVKDLNTMAIVDAISPGNTFVAPLANKSRDSKLFQFQDKIYAIVSDHDNLPQLVLISSLKTSGDAQ